MPDVLYRLGEPLLRYIELVSPVLHFMRLKKADSASILRTLIGEVIWHTFLRLEATPPKRAMILSRRNEARRSSSPQLKREWSLWPEFGWISGNLCDLSKG